MKWQRKQRKTCKWTRGYCDVASLIIAAEDGVRSLACIQQPHSSNESTQRKRSDPPGAYLRQGANHAGERQVGGDGSIMGFYLSEGCNPMLNWTWQEVNPVWPSSWLLRTVIQSVPTARSSPGQCSRRPAFNLLCLLLCLFSLCLPSLPTCLPFNLLCLLLWLCSLCLPSSGRPGVASFRSLGLHPSYYLHCIVLLVWLNIWSYVLL